MNDKVEQIPNNKIQTASLTSIIGATYHRRDLYEYRVD